jgi:hypothetical protein
LGILKKSPVMILELYMFPVFTPEELYPSIKFSFVSIFIKASPDYADILFQSNCLVGSPLIEKPPLGIAPSIKLILKVKLVSISPGFHNGIVELLATTS